MVGLNFFENRYGEVRLRQDPDFPRREGYVDVVRNCRIQLHKGIPRTPWLVAVRAFRRKLYVSQPNNRKARTAA